MSSLLPKVRNEHNRKSFVRAGVEENEITKKLIDRILPYFPKSAQVIGGWVDTSKQYWKVNFHWEYLLLFMDKSLAMQLSDKHEKCVKAIRSVLKSNPPNPPTGYVASKVMGSPKDGSSRELVLKRWKTLRQCKKDFKSVMDAAKLLAGMTEKKRKAWYLAVAPVASPGTSKHGAGYALDIYGDNAEIKRISRALGASLVFDEASHVHVEFAKEIQANAPGPGPEASGEPRPPAGLQRDYSNEVCWMTPHEVAEIENDLRQAPVCEAYEDVRHPEVLQCLVEDPLATERRWSRR